jgi:hypothetical protein
MQNYHSLIYHKEEREMNAYLRPPGSTVRKNLGVRQPEYKIPTDLWPAPCSQYYPLATLSRGLLTRPRDKSTSTHWSKPFLQKDDDPNFGRHGRVHP